MASICTRNVFDWMDSHLHRILVRKKGLHRATPWLLGFRVNLKAVGRAQPRLGFAVVFPLNNLERRNEHWATITSLVFDF
jgi:hypothetical protein